MQSEVLLFIFLYSRVLFQESRRFEGQEANIRVGPATSKISGPVPDSSEYRLSGAILTYENQMEINRIGTGYYFYRTIGPTLAQICSLAQSIEFLS